MFGLEALILLAAASLELIIFVNGQKFFLTLFVHIKTSLGILVCID